MFEKLLNLDAELMVLKTKAFVAKEEFLSERRYKKAMKKIEKNKYKEDDSMVEDDGDNESVEDAMEALKDELGI